MKHQSMIRKSLMLSVLLLMPFFAFAEEEPQWKARWMSVDECQSEPNTWLNFRKTVNLTTIPQSVKAYIAADSKYWLWINGEQVVFEGCLKRGPSPTDTYYDEVDLASYLKPGKNVIAIRLWYFGKQGFSHNSSSKAGLLFDCQAPGIEILSGDNWEASIDDAFGICDEPYPNYRLSESSILYDARKDKGRWQFSDGQTKGMHGTTEQGEAGVAPWGKLVRRPIPLWKDYGLKEYVSVEHRGDTLICKLPYNAQITPYFKIKAKEGLKISLFTDHYHIYNGNVPNIRAEYITREGLQEYENPGWINGHNMYYIIPKEVEVLQLQYRETGYDCNFSGRFECSDDFLNQLWIKAQRTLYVTIRDTYMDCPERERCQWTGDAVNESGETFYALSTSSHTLTKKWLLELAGWQKKDSVLYAPVPAGNWRKELPSQVLASVGYYGLWNYYLHTNDRQTLKDVYPAFAKYLSLYSMTKDNVLEPRFGGWYWGDWGDNCDMDLLTNAWYYLAIKGMYLVAEELGFESDSNDYKEKMLKIRKSFNKYFWNGSEYRTPSYKNKTDDRGQALAVVAGLVDKEKYSALLKVFQKEQHASPYMEKYVFEAMMMMGYDKEALARHKSRFSEMVYWLDLTTLFEHFHMGSGGFKGGSVNHAWSGGGLTVSSQYITGIEPLEAGYKTFKVMPRTAGLSYAKAVVPSVRGEIRAEFTDEIKTFSLQTDVPNGTAAILGVPTKGIKEIEINKKVVWKNGKYIPNNLASEWKNEYNEHICFLVKDGKYKIIAHR